MLSGCVIDCIIFILFLVNIFEESCGAEGTGSFTWEECPSFRRPCLHLLPPHLLKPSTYTCFHHGGSKCTMASAPCVWHHHAIQCMVLPYTCLHHFPHSCLTTILCTILPMEINFILASKILWVFVRGCVKLGWKFRFSLWEFAVTWCSLARLCISYSHSLLSAHWPDSIKKAELSRG